MLVDAMALGISEEEFWHLNPRRLDLRMRAYHKKRQILDARLYMQGYYFYLAIGAALSPKSHYPKEPLSMKDDKWQDGRDLSDLEVEEAKRELVNTLNTLGARVNGKVKADGRK